MIPDPEELLESQIESQILLLDAEGKYPCVYCGTRYAPKMMVTISANPASALMCYDCCDAQNQINALR